MEKSIIIPNGFVYKFEPDDSKEYIRFRDYNIPVSHINWSANNSPDFIKFKIKYRNSTFDAFLDMQNGGDNLFVYENNAVIGKGSLNFKKFIKAVSNFSAPAELERFNDKFKVGVSGSNKQFESSALNEVKSIESDKYKYETIFNKFVNVGSGNPVKNEFIFMIGKCGSELSILHGFFDGHLYRRFSNDEKSYNVIGWVYKSDIK